MGSRGYRADLAGQRAAEHVAVRTARVIARAALLAMRQDRVYVEG